MRTPLRTLTLVMLVLALSLGARATFADEYDEYYYDDYDEDIEYTEEDDGAGTDVAEEEPVEDKEPPAPRTCVVTYNANGGVGEMPDTLFTEGLPGPIERCTYTRSGYTFEGWTTEPNGSGQHFPDGVDLTPYDTGADDGLDNSAWYVAALRWANANRITLSDRPFGGREAIRRGEFAVMLSNYLRYRGVSAEAPADATFTDADALTEDELHAFRVLQAADVFRGYSDGSVRPETYLTRAQLSALLHRLSQYIIQAESGT